MYYSSWAKQCAGRRDNLKHSNIFQAPPIIAFWSRMQIKESRLLVSLRCDTKMERDAENEAPRNKCPALKNG